MLSPTVLVTGAGSGLGLGLADLYARRGLAVIALDLTCGAPARRRLEAAGRSGVYFAEADVRDDDAVRNAVTRGVQALGPLHIAINCAGIQDAALFADLSPDAFRRVVDVNLIGSRNVAAAVLQHLRPGGHLVLVSSMAGLVGTYAYAAYCASKFGVVGLAQVLRLELAPRGIAVSVVCPPEVNTPMVVEERRSMLAPTRALKAMTGTLELDPAVREILAGIDKRRTVIVPGAAARRTALLTRILPRRAVELVTDRVVRRALAEGT